MVSVRVTSIEGNTQKLDGGAMFGNAPKALWTRWYQPDDQGRIELSCRSALIQTEDANILLETGIGNFFSPELMARYGIGQPNQHRLIENLQRVGLREKDIDLVVLSHLHFDHAGGLLSSFDPSQPDAQKLLFPKARYFVGKEAFERAVHPHARDRASFIPGLTDKLQSSGRLTLIKETTEETSAETAPEPYSDLLSFFFSHGHTPGHMHTIVQGSTRRLIFAGDLVPGSAWIHLPITMGYDRFAEKVIDEKQALYERMQAEDLLFFTHDPEIDGATIHLENKKHTARQTFSSLEDFAI